MRLVKTIATTAALACAALGVTAPQKAQAQAEPLLGQVSLFGFNFCPRGWAPADGQLLPIAQYNALFSLFGTIYGGDGRTTFALPDLRGRAPINDGDGTGLPDYNIGNRGGSVDFTLTTQNLPSHNHLVNATTESATKGGPGDDFLAVPKVVPNTTRVKIYGEGPADTVMDQAMIGHTGSNTAVSKRSPYLAMNWCVALQGIFPSRE